MGFDILSPKPKIKYTIYIKYTHTHSLHERTAFFATFKGPVLATVGVKRVFPMALDVCLLYKGCCYRDACEVDCGVKTDDSTSATVHISDNSSNLRPYSKGTCSASEMLVTCCCRTGYNLCRQGNTNAAHRTVTIATLRFSPRLGPHFPPLCFPRPSLARFVHHPAATTCTLCWSPSARGPHRHRDCCCWTCGVTPATGAAASGVGRQRRHTGDQLHSFSLDARHGCRLGAHDYFPAVVHT